MTVPSVWVQSGVPGFEGKSIMVIGFETNNLDIFKVHIIGEKVTWPATLEFWSKLATAFLCSTIQVFSDLSIMP